MDRGFVAVVAQVYIGLQFFDQYLHGGKNIALGLDPLTRDAADARRHHERRGVEFGRCRVVGVGGHSRRIIGRSPALAARKNGVAPMNSS